MGKLTILLMLLFPASVFARNPDSEMGTPPVVASAPSVPRISVASAGVDFLFPTVRYERLHREDTAWGVALQYITYATNSATINGPGLVGSYTYFPVRPFDGPAIRLSLGTLLLTASELSGNSSTYASLNMALNAGWRWRWDRGFAFAAGLGVQRFFHAHPSGIAEDFSGVLPSMEMSFGYLW